MNVLAGAAATAIMESLTCSNPSVKLKAAQWILEKQNLGGKYALPSLNMDFDWTEENEKVFEYLTSLGKI